MITIVGKAVFPDGALEAVMPVLETFMAATRAERGCLDFALSREVGSDTVLRVVETWADTEALANHFQTPHMAVFRNALAEVGPMDLHIVMFDVEPKAIPGL